MEFESFGKISRLKRMCVITEKIDGTNAQIAIDADGNMQFGSRNRWITPDDDNYGFAKWGDENASELSKLGEGRHFGEWWGAGIQRGYGLSEKRFSLFNVSRWRNERPTCCDIVPILYEGEFTTEAVDTALNNLRFNGSRASIAFPKPEGVIVYMAASGHYYKVTYEKDAEHKGHLT
jgi:RNA ligase